MVLTNLSMDEPLRRLPCHLEFKLKCLQPFKYRLVCCMYVFFGLCVEVNVGTLLSSMD